MSEAKRVAVIDMGTNTFNLLIAEPAGNDAFNILHSSKFPVKLGEGGINSGYITPEAYSRGIEAVGKHIEVINRFGVEKVFAFATSATRNASNGSALVNEIRKLYGINVRIIDGDTEAELIYYGVRQSVRIGESNALILDIGGGSNELIIANSQNYLWKRSYNLGVSRLTQMFAPTDPIAMHEIRSIEAYIGSVMSDLDAAMTTYHPQTLIGSSGSFDTYRSLLAEAGAIERSSASSVEFPLNEYLNLHGRLLVSTASERAQMPGMDPMRVEMIVVASIFTHYLIERYGIKGVMQSNYALKEGAVWWLNQLG